MRITDNTRLLAMLRAGKVTTARVADAQRRAAAGARVVAPSDDPVAYATLVRRDAELASVSARSKVARDASDDLAIAENALDSASTVMQTALGLAVQGANESLAPNDRKAIAQQIDGLRDELVALANTKSDRGFLFAGTKTDTEPFTKAGAFLGNDGVITVRVTDGLAPRGNVSGARAFTSAGGRDVLADLAALSAALGANDLSAVKAALDGLKAGHDQIVSAQVDAGISMERLQTSADVLDRSAVTLTSTRSRAIGGDDPAALLTQLSATSTAYQQSLAVTRQLLSLPSLASL